MRQRCLKSFRVLLLLMRLVTNMTLLLLSKMLPGSVDDDRLPILAFLTEVEEEPDEINDLGLAILRALRKMLLTQMIWIVWR